MVEEFAMPMTPAQARARAQVAARRRHHGAAADIAKPAAELERAQLDKHITALVAARSRAPEVTWRLAPEDLSALRRLLRLLFDPDAVARGGDGDGAAA
jgi:hypothetical protein